MWTRNLQPNRKKSSKPTDQRPDFCIIWHISTNIYVNYLFIFGRYVDRISNAKWEVKELGLEHNGSVSLVLILYLLVGLIFKFLIYRFTLLPYPCQFLTVHVMLLPSTGRSIT